MTDEELAAYYANLLILQYRGAARAYATIKAQVGPVIMNQLPVAVQDAFDIETAVGAQLDILGKYIGASRMGYGTSGQPITLDDDDYRILLKMVLIKNNSGSSLATIQQLLIDNFSGYVFVSDNATMALSYVVVETLGSEDLLEMLIAGKFFPAPMGVATSVTVVPAHVYPFFGFRTYSAPDPTVAGFNNYVLYVTTSIWLSYSL